MSSSNNSSDKLVSSWPKGWPSVGDGLIRTQHCKKKKKKITTVLENQTEVTERLLKKKTACTE